MTFDRRLRAALAALLLTFFTALPSYAVVDRDVRSSSDPGGTTGTAAQFRTNINEEVNAVDTRAAMTLGSVSGTNDYTASVTPTLTSLVSGQSFWFKPSVTNTSTVRLNINSIGLTAVTSSAGVALGAGDLQSTNWYLLYYNGTNFRQMTSPGAASGSGQYAFPATQNPAAGANILDDYEEGTWTPAFSATGATFNYVSQAGFYTKVGRFVSFSFRIQLATSGNTLSSNAVSLTGLPFPVSNTTNYVPEFPVRWRNSTTSYIQVLGQAQLNTSQIVFVGNTAATTDMSTVLNADTLLHATNGSIVFGTGSYMQ